MFRFKQTYDEVLLKERSIIQNFNNELVSLKNKIQILSETDNKIDNTNIILQENIDEMTKKIDTLDNTIVSLTLQLSNNLTVINGLLKELVIQNNLSTMSQLFLYDTVIEEPLSILDKSINYNASKASSQYLSIPTVLNYGLYNNNEFIFIGKNITLTLNHSVIASNKLYLGSIGGGAGGGGGSDGTSPGGGGGGAVTFISNLECNAGTAWNVVTGAPGTGGGSGKTGINGKSSSIKSINDSSLNLTANGGYAGSKDSRGNGGTGSISALGNGYYAIGGNGGDQSDGSSSLYQYGTNPFQTDYQEILNLGILYCTSTFSGGGGGSHTGNEMYPYFSGRAGTNVGGKRGLELPVNGDKPESPGTLIGLPAFHPGSGGGAGGQRPDDFAIGEAWTGDETVNNIYYSGGPGGWGMNFAGVKQSDGFAGYFNYLSKNIKFYETASYYVWCVLEGTCSFVAPYDITSSMNLSALIVGGGGGGGASDGGVSDGGGTGGGMVYIPNITLPNGGLFVGFVGVGGEEGVVSAQTGKTGMPTYLTKCADSTSSSWNAIAMGGGPGNRDARGSVIIEPIDLTYILPHANGGYRINGLPSGSFGLFGGNGGDESNGMNGSLNAFGNVNTRTKIPFPSELLNINIPEIREYYGGGGGGAKSGNEDKNWSGGSGGTSYGEGGKRGFETTPSNGYAGVGYGGGGGAGGAAKSSEKNGGKGADGVIVLYMKKII